MSGLGTGSTPLILASPAPSGAGVTSLNGLIGALTIVAGSGITVTPSGSNITIAATGGGSGFGFAAGAIVANSVGNTPANGFTLGAGGQIIFDGSTTGSVTIGALGIAGSSTLTFPAFSGPGEIVVNQGTQTTIGAVGAASAVPILPVGYILVDVGGSVFAMPYYNAS
jgi:hypothetical protein